MEAQKHHEELISGISQQLKPVLDGSTQGIYIYLDDVHKVCNERFAAMLGYGSAQKWGELQGSFLDLMVDKGSQDALAAAYRKAVEQYLGSCLDVTWKKKDGSLLKTKVILAPIVFDKHPLALHFVSQA